MGMRASCELELNVNYLYKYSRENGLPSPDQGEQSQGCPRISVADARKWVEAAKKDLHQRIRKGCHVLDTRTLLDLHFAIIVIGGCIYDEWHRIIEDWEKKFPNATDSEGFPMQIPDQSYFDVEEKNWYIYFG